MYVYSLNANTKIKTEVQLNKQSQKGKLKYLIVNIKYIQTLYQYKNNS